MLIRSATSDSDRLRQLYRQLRNSCLHLGMTVGAKEHAFRCLLTKLGNRASDPANPQSEGLASWIDMMKLKRPSVASVATKRTLAASLGDEDLLDFPASSGDRFRSTSCASETRLRCDPDMRCQAMPSTAQLRLFLATAAHRSQGCAPPRALSLQSVTLEPVARCRISNSQSARNSLDRQALFHQGFELGT